MAGRGLSLRATARDSGCSPGYLSNVIHGRKTLTPSVAARLDKVLGTGSAFTEYAGDKPAAYARNTPSASSGIPPGHASLRRASGAISDPDGYHAVGDVAGDALTGLGARGTTPGALATFAAADLAAPQHDLRAEVSAVRSSELLLRTAERAAFGVAAFPPDAAAAAGAVTENDAIQVEIVTAVFRSWDNAQGGGLRRKAVVGQLAEVTALLGGPYTSEQASRRFYIATADLAQLAGWMSWDLRLQATAQHYYLLALALARDAGDRSQVARMMYCLTRQQIDLGHHDEALELAAAGVYAIRRSSSPRASALLHIAQARAHACLGEERDCRAALGAAQDAYAHDGTDPGWCGFFAESELHGLIGVTLRDLALAIPDHARRIAPEARRWIEQAAAARPGAFLRSKVLDTDGIAITSILAREPDRAAAAADEAIALGRQVQSPRAVNRLLATITMGSRAFPGDAPWGDLGERARGLLSAR
jgi:hypothetical protein